MRRLGVVLVVLMAVCLGAAWALEERRASRPAPPVVIQQGSAVVSSPPGEPEPNHELLLLGTTPEGVRVYRLNGPKAIVPIVFAVSPNGSVAIR